VIEKLLQKGVDHHARDEEGRTVLYHIVYGLVTFGPNTEIGKESLALFVDCFQILLKWGSWDDKDDTSYLLYPMANPIDVNMKDFGILEWTILHHLVSEIGKSSEELITYYIQCLEFLLTSSNVDINMPDNNYGDSALFIAARFGNSI